MTSGEYFALVILFIIVMICKFVNFKFLLQLTGRGACECQWPVQCDTRKKISQVHQIFFNIFFSQEKYPGFLVSLMFCDFQVAVENCLVMFTTLYFGYYCTFTLSPWLLRNNFLVVRCN